MFSRTVRSGTVESLCIRTRKQWENEMALIPERDSILQMLFLTSELAYEAEITIRDTTRPWVPGRGIMGRNIGVYKNEYNTWF